MLNYRCQLFSFYIFLSTMFVLRSVHTEKDKVDTVKEEM